jgi:hypothetical protein
MSINTNNQNKHIISLLVNNKPGVLIRISLVFSRRGYNIDSLVTHVTQNPKYSMITITALGEYKTPIPHARNWSLCSKKGVGGFATCRSGCSHPSRGGLQKSPCLQPANAIVPNANSNAIVPNANSQPDSLRRCFFTPYH